MVTLLYDYGVEQSGLLLLAMATFPSNSQLRLPVFGKIVITAVACEPEEKSTGCNRTAGAGVNRLLAPHGIEMVESLSFRYPKNAINHPALKGSGDIHSKRGITE
jgi:hypothetical protein